MNSQAISVTRLRKYRSAIVACSSFSGKFVAAHFGTFATGTKRTFQRISRRSLRAIPVLLSGSLMPCPRPRWHQGHLSRIHPTGLGDRRGAKRRAMDSRMLSALLAEVSTPSSFRGRGPMSWGVAMMWGTVIVAVVLAALAANSLGWHRWRRP
jgi:hypothetical protein